MRKLQRLRDSTEGGKSDRDGGAPLLSCRRVTRTFGALAAVNKLSFDIEPGIVFGIGGPNGAGKTTLFDLICGLTPLSGGEITFKGRRISGLKPFEICHAGVARTFQLNAAFDTMTVRENVLIAIQHGARHADVPRLFFNRAERRWCDQVLETMDLADVAEETVARLPLVKQKLLMIAAAIGTRPSMLLLDEPVGGLLPREIDQVERVIRSLAADSGITVMLIEHVMRFLVGLSDEVMIMNHGEILYKGLPKGLSKDRKVVETYLGEGTSGRLSAQTEAASVNPVELDFLDDAAPDPWSQKVEAAARRLLMQHRSGRIYPIDFLRLESILTERTEVDDLNAITRVARDIIKARSEGAPVSQKFELLARIFTEVAGVRKSRAPSAATKQVGDVRAQAIEKAARDLVSREGSRIDARALEALRGALERSTPEEIVPAPDAISGGLR